MKGLNVDNLIIEVGRKCNLKCAHCLRGDAEDVTVDVSTVKKFLKEFEYISTITFSGGEPTLYEDEICEIIDFILQEKIEIGNFYVASNGMRKAPKLMIKLAELYAYISVNSLENYSQFELSYDEFHDEIPKQNEEFYRAFSFFSKRDYQGWNDYWIPEGRALENGLSGSGRFLSTTFCYDKDCEEVEEIYFNAEGYLIPDCDYSYSSQRAMNPYKYGEMPLREILSNFGYAKEEVA